MRYMVKFRLFYLDVKNNDLGVGDILHVKEVVSRAHFQNTKAILILPII